MSELVSIGHESPDHALERWNRVMGPAWPVCAYCSAESEVFYTSSRMTPQGVSACSIHRHQARAERDRRMSGPSSAEVLS